MKLTMITLLAGGLIAGSLGCAAESNVHSADEQHVTETNGASTDEFASWLQDADASGDQVSAASFVFAEISGSDDLLAGIDLTLWDNGTFRVDYFELGTDDGGASWAYTGDDDQLEGAYQYEPASSEIHASGLGAIRAGTFEGAAALTLVFDSDIVTPGLAGNQTVLLRPEQ